MFSWKNEDSDQNKVENIVCQTANTTKKNATKQKKRENGEELKL